MDIDLDLKVKLKRGFKWIDTDIVSAEKRDTFGYMLKATCNQ